MQILQQLLKITIIAVSKFKYNFDDIFILNRDNKNKIK